MSTAVPADLVLVNGVVHTMPDVAGDTGAVEALAVRGGRVVATGRSAEMRGHVGEATTVVDLQGRCVVPGLIDNHIHFVRAGLTWKRELRWERCPDLATGLRMIADAAATSPEGEWTLVIGGWHERQFPEQRGPVRAELDAAAPHAPVFVQMLYDWAAVNGAGMRAIGLDDEVARAAGEHLFEWDDAGHVTGRVLGMEGCKWLYARLPRESFEDQVEGTARLSRDLNRFAVTALVDGGGVSTSPEVYDAVYETDRRHALTVRSFLTVHASAPGLEEEELGGYLRFTRVRHGSDMLQVLGAGEVILYALHDRVHTPVEVTPEKVDRLVALLTRLARRGWTVQMHAHRPETVAAYLDACARVAAEVPLAPLRWGIVHAETLREQDVPRLAELGLSAVTQSLMRFLGDQLIAAFDEETAAAAPPMRALLDSGVPVSGGTDAMRGASFDPFTSLHFYVTGEMIGGRRIVGEENLLTREEALRIYTRGSAYDCFREDELGALRPGWRADLAVLSADYFSVDAAAIPTIESELTLVGGRPVHVGAAYADTIEVAPHLADRAPATIRTDLEDPL